MSCKGKRMSEAPPPTAIPGLSLAESERMQTAIKDIAERSQKLLQDFAERYKADGQQPADPLHLTQTFMDLTAKMMADPNRLVQAQMELWQQYMKLWQATAQRMMGQPGEPGAEPGKGRLAIRQTDMKAFKVGENVATSPGKVVYQNELIQLLQYAPATAEVHAMPLLIVPPWINKFYILDLKPENSFIKWATEQGYTVFVVSWVNPDEHLTKLAFDDYMKLGPLAALDAIEKAAGQRQVSAIGYCIGGTLMAATLAYMAAPADDPIAACTFFTAQADFTEPGERGGFIH